jgi:hypothetical protein
MRLNLKIPRIGLVLPFFLTLAVMLGIAIPVLDLKLGALFGLLILTFTYLLLALLLPDRDPPPQRLLMWMLLLTTAFLFLWPRYAYIPIHALPTKNPQRIFHAVIIALSVFFFCTSKVLRERIALRFSSGKVIVLLIISFFIWQFISTIFSNIPLLSMYVFGIQIFEYLSMFLLALMILRDNDDIEAMISALLWVTFLICCIGLIEAVMKKNLFEPLLVIDNTVQTNVGEILGTHLREGMYRIKATFAHPLLFAEFVTSMLPLIAYRFAYGGAKAKLMMSGLVLMILPVLYFTHSRSAWAVMAILGIIFAAFFVVRSSKYKKFNYSTVISLLLVPALIGGAISAYMILLTLSHGTTAEERISSMARVIMLEKGIPLIEAQPVVGYGVGLGGYTLGFVGEGGMLTLDNYYLLLALDSGLLALMIFCLMLVWTGKKLITALTLQQRNYSTRLAALALSVIGIAIFQTILGTTHNFPLLFLLLATMIVVLEISNSEDLSE